MAKKKLKDEEQEEMVMVGPGAEVDDDEEEEKETEETPEEGEEEEEEPRRKKVIVEDEGSEDSEEDERVGHGEDDEEDSGDGKEKRETRKARRERQRRARQRNELELNFLRQRNEALEKKVGDIEQRQTRTEVGNLDQRIGSMQSQLKVADQVFAKAVAAGDEEDVVEAQNIRDKIKENLGKLTNFKAEVTRRAEERPDEPPVDSRLVFHAQQWINRNKWYDPNGGDQDSRAVTAIDNRLVQEGYDPRTPEYWDELETRTKRRLPHKFKANGNGHVEEGDDNEPTPRREERRGSGPRFSVGGRERPLRKNEVYVTPDRKQALIEAGVWDDPVLRNKYLKRYSQWDRENPRGR
jgi:hypothetical protein